MKFTELDQLNVYLQKDAQVPDTCPVRFIHVTSLEMWKQVKAYLLTLADRQLLLSDFCEDDDTSPNLRQLKANIRTSKTATVVLPLSEYLRINLPIAERTIDDILKASYEHNSSGKLRIYILLYRMNDILSKVELDPRQKKSILYLDTIADTDYSLTIMQEDLDISLEGNQVKGYREYLMYWEQNPDKPVIFHTNNANLYQNIMFADNVTVIVSSYDLLRYHYHMPTVIQQDWGSETQWRELARCYHENENFENVICHQLSAPQYSDSLFENWTFYSSQKHWLLWLLVKFKCPKGYIGLAAKATMSVESFVESIYQEIIEQIESVSFDQLAKERRKLILDMKLKPTSDYLDRIATLEPGKQLRCLTDLSQKEKRLILLAYARNPSAAAREMLHLVYPDAYAYLSGKCNFESERLEKYFAVYRALKISNQTSDSFLAEVNEIARENLELVWKLEARNARVNSLYDSGTVVLFVDALGVEYLPFLSQMLGASSEYDVESYTTRCNLPSTTEFNTDFLDGKQQDRTYKLDELKHSSVEYPDSIISELDLLLEIGEKVRELLLRYSTVILTGDHGTSRTAVLYRNHATVHQAKEGSQLKKYGRFCVDEANDYSDIDGCIQHDDFWIFANYSRFAERGAPQCEIHGGAALEETIVPVLRIRKKEKGAAGAPIIRIFGYPKEIQVGPSKSAAVSFKLSVQCASVTVVLGNQRIDCDFTNGEYTFKVPVGVSGKHTFKLVSEGKVLGEITIDFIKGITSKSGFDI